MAKLSPEQLAFLAAHGIPPGTVFDASGMRRSAYQRTMAEKGRAFAYGVGICNRLHRAIRTRAGHCIQCNPARIAFALRDDISAFVYIAGSARAELIKVGLTTDLDARQRNLRIERWAGCSDWQVLAFVECPEAGRAERAAHALLSTWSTSCEYSQGGTRHQSCEVFRCDFADARDALLAVRPQGACLTIHDEMNALAKFNFRRR